MDNDAKMSCNNTGDVKNAGESLEKESASNNAIVEISDKSNSKSSAEDEKASTSHRQQNGYFQKETESCEIVKNVWNSFNSFQRTVANIHKTDKRPYNASYDFTSVIEKYLISRTSDNLPEASDNEIQLIEENDEDAEDNGIISSQSLLTTKYSSSGSKIIRKCEKCLSFSNSRIHKREMHCDIFNEDDDWDIYQPGIVMTELILNTESSLEPQFSFKRPMLKDAQYLKNNPECSDDYDSCQRVSPHIKRIFPHIERISKHIEQISPHIERVSPNITRESNYSPSCNSLNSWDISPDWNEERMLKEVKQYFLNNPVQVMDNLSDYESRKRIISAPYFSRDFALRHGLPLHAINFIQELSSLEDQFKVSRILEAFEMMSKLEISEEEFFRYISLDYHRTADTSPQKWYTCSGLDLTTVRDLDLLQEKVGPDILHIIYEQLGKGDAEFLALFRDQEILNTTIRFWNEYRKTEHLREHANSGDNFLPQNRADSISNVISQDILVSQTDADFPSSATCQSHVIKTSGLNESDSNSYADDGTVKTIHKILKTSESSTGLSKVQSIKANDISETMLKKCSSILQSTNQDNKEIRNSFGPFQDNSDQSNGSRNPASIMLPHIQNSDVQNEEKSSRVHSVKLRNSPNNATHSDQNFKESRDVQAGKSNEVLENDPNMQPGVRKHFSQVDAKSRKRTRLQENLNIGQTESKQEESPRKDESRASSQDSCPGKPGNKSCIVM